MDGFSVFKIYVALKTHFESKTYDVFKYNGKTKNQKFEHYLKRKDYPIFERLGKTFKSSNEVVTFFVSNFAFGNMQVLYSDMSLENQKKWLRETQSISKIFEEDLDMIFSCHGNNLEQIFVVGSGEPILIKYLLRHEISFFTVVILCAEFNVIKKYGWDDMLLWSELSLRIKKTIPFVQYNTKKITEILNNKYLEF